MKDGKAIITVEDCGARNIDLAPFLNSPAGKKMLKSVGEMWRKIKEQNTAKAELKKLTC